MAILDGSCAFEGERGLATLDGPEVHDIALALRGEDGVWAVWSEDSGLYVAGLDAAGALELPSRRIGPPCPAGIDAASGPSLFVACGMPADDAKGDPGHALVYEVSAEAARVRDRFAGMGPDARGVAIAASSERYHLAWHDARRGSAAVWSVVVPFEAAPAIPEELRDMLPAVLGPEPVRASREGQRAGPPSLALVGETRYLAWAETSLDADGDPIGEVFVQEADGAPRAIATVQHELSEPTLAVRGDRVLVTFRDRRDRGRPRAHSMWLPARNEDGALAVAAPANTLGPALGIPCMESVLEVAPRTHSRHERLVSVRRHEAESLAGQGPELQIYAHGAAYEVAAAICLPASPSGTSAEHLFVLFAARESDEHEPGHLRTTAVRCEDAR